MSCTSASPLGLIGLFMYDQALQREGVSVGSAVEERLFSKLGRVLPAGVVSWLSILSVVAVKERGSFLDQSTRRGRIVRIVSR